jgi:predicted RNA-binding Zn-ribbon protein involved in translation (DUF1610 family)
MSDPVLCPECGWTGVEADLERTAAGYECPVCAEVVELID